MPYHFYVNVLSAGLLWDPVKRQNRLKTSFLRSPLFLTLLLNEKTNSSTRCKTGYSAIQPGCQARKANYQSCIKNKEGYS